MSKDINFIDRLKSGSRSALVLRVVGAVMLILMHTTIGRTLGKDGYGIFSYAVAVTGFLALIVTFGWQTALTRFISSYIEDKQWGLIKGSLIRAHQITFISSITASFILLAISFDHRVSEGVSLSLRFASLLLPLAAFSVLRNGIFMGLQKVKASIAPDGLIMPALVLGVLLILSIKNPSGVLFAYVASMAVVVVSCGWWLWRSIPTDSLQAMAEYRTRKWMGVALPMVFGSISQMVMNRTDILMLGVLSDMQSVALYSASNRIAMVNTFVLVSVNTIAVPMLSVAYQSGRASEFRAIKRRVMIWSSCFSLPLLIVMVAWPGEILVLLFGIEFEHGENLLQVLAFGQFVNAITGPVGFALLMSGREKYFARSMAIIAVANIIGNIYAIQLWGAIGAAFVTAGSVIVLNTWQLLLARTSVVFEKDKTGKYNI